MDVGMVVAICVLALFTFVYLTIFFLVFSLEKKSYLSGNEDGEVREEIHKDYKKYLRKKKENEDFVSYSLKKNRSKKQRGIVYSGIVWIFCIFCAGVIAFSAHLKSNNDQFYFGDTTFLVVQTGSMSSKNDRNDYLVGYDNQIQTNSLIGIESIAEEDMKLYDIYAFKMDDSVIVHRLIGIETDNGVTTYTFRGDANTGSLSEEMNLPFSDIIGRYNGFKSQILGNAFVYLQSGIGVISLACAAIILLGYDAFRGGSLNSYEARYNYLSYNAYKIYLDYENYTYLKKQVRCHNKNNELSIYSKVITLLEKNGYPEMSHGVVVSISDNKNKVEVLLNEVETPTVVEYKSDEIYVC